MLDLKRELKKYSFRLENVVKYLSETGQGIYHRCLVCIKNKGHTKRGSKYPGEKLENLQRQPTSVPCNFVNALAKTHICTLTMTQAVSKLRK